MGDFKFVFMVLGRDGHSGTHCLYYQLMHNQWKQGNKLTGDIDLQAEEWTIKKSTNSYL